MEHDYLRTSVAADWVECPSINDLIVKATKQFVDYLLKLEVNRERLHLIDHAVRNISIKMHVLDAEDRI